MKDNVIGFRILGWLKKKFRLILSVDALFRCLWVCCRSYWCSFVCNFPPSLAPSKSFFSVVFNDSVMMLCLSGIFFMFILPWVQWAFWIWTWTFNLVWKNCVHFFRYFFLPSPPFPGTPVTCIWNCLSASVPALLRYLQPFTLSVFHVEWFSCSFSTDFFSSVASDLLSHTVCCFPRLFFYLQVPVELVSFSFGFFTSSVSLLMVFMFPFMSLSAFMVFITLL